MTNHAHVWSSGSTWRRWDPHIHTPATLHNNQFGGDWDGFIARINTATPAVSVLGVTEYCGILGYQELRQRWLNDKLPGVEYIFPNVELRLTIETAAKKPINLHLLFSPDDPEHEVHIERMLAGLHFEYDGNQYSCTKADLIRLGRAFDVSQKSDEHGALQVGARQFKVTFAELRDLWKKQRWLRENCVVAVAGAEGDGTSGLQQDDGFAAQRKEIERFSHFIFSGKSTDQEYWLGRKPGFDLAYLIQNFGGPKACLHGCDAHDLAMVLAPKLDRYCWIRAEPTFEGLRQVILTGC